jgi:hypothetical protein
MSTNDEEAIRCAEHLIEAMQNLRRVLERREENIRRSLGIRLTPEDEYRAVFKDTLITEDREDLTEALFQLDRCRRASRVASFRSALDHGMSINELARIWGFSRQMASRYAKEARGEI